MTAPAAAVNARPRGAKALRRFLRNRLGVVGLVIVVAFSVMAAFAPVLAPYDPAQQSLLERRKGPSAEHLLGTDEFGRDILSRVIYGARVSLVVAVASVGIGLVLGTALGALAGYVGGAVDTVVMRTMDLLLAFPYLLLAIVIVAVLGPGLANTIIAIGIWAVPNFARVARSAIVQMKERDFVAAARALGAKDGRIVGRHLVPNIVSTLVVYASLYLAYAILMEAALSFLGLGTPPDVPSWGNMLREAQGFLAMSPYPALVPGLAIVWTVLGWSLLGDGLRDLLDPRTA